MKLCLIDSYLIFWGGPDVLYDCSWILENIGSVCFLYTGDFFYFGLDHRVVVMLPNFR